MRHTRTTLSLAKVDIFHVSGAPLGDGPMEQHFGGSTLKLPRADARQACVIMNNTSAGEGLPVGPTVLTGSLVQQVAPL